MRRQLVMFVFISLAGLVAGGCSRVQVRDYNTGLMDFKGMKTYAWVSAAQPKSGNPRLDTNALLNTAVREDINNALKEKGYTLVESSAKPDFLIAYRPTLDQRVSISADDSGGGYNPYYEYAEGTQRPTGDDSARMSGVNTFEQGTLVIDVADPQTRRVVWRVTGTDTVRLKNSPERKRKNLRRAIDEMLAKFPPKSAP